MQTLLAGTGWLLLGCGKHAAPPPPAAHLEPVAPMASAVRPSPPRVTTRDRVTLDGSFHAPSARDDRGDTPRVFAKAIRAMSTIRSLIIYPASILLTN